MTLPHIVLVLAVNLVFGFNLVAAKFVMEQLPPLAFASLRFLLLFLVLFPVLKIIRGRMLLITGVALSMGALHFTLIYQGLALADDVSTVAIALQLAVPFSTVLSIIFLGEQVRWKRWTGIALSFAGVMIIGFDPRVLGYLPALAFVIAGALMAASGMLLMKKLEGVSVFELQGWLAVISWPLLAAASLGLEDNQAAAIAGVDTMGWAAVGFSAIGASLFGHGATYYLVQRYDVSLISPLMLMSTLFGVMFGVMLLDDQLTLRIVLGGVLTLGGVLLITLRSPTQPASAALDQPSVSGSKHR
ncbi:DMT family transporter [Lentisalinibacter orientalis]|uniref:DMT family transporter n=1 Tax=Lentisalinibacter orientalis TaxID=2992241 RepID=UPI0038674780